MIQCPQATSQPHQGMRTSLKFWKFGAAQEVCEYELERTYVVDRTSLSLPGM